MAVIDWIILALYLIFTVALGFFSATKNKNENDYFVAGRRLSGWLAGASMAATTFSIDTPLYVAGLVGTRGLAANWEWWGFGLAHVAMAVVFAPLFEEIIFRGALLPVLATEFGRWWGVFISGLVFALAHLSVGELAPLTVLGFGLALLRLSSGRLFPCVLMHSLWNGVTFANLLLLGS